jgi:hypothetical protein
MASGVHPMEMSEARAREIKTTAEVITGGSLGEIIGGAGGLVLGILGLSGILPMYLAPIAAIAVGGALVLQGGALAARFRRLLAEATEGAVGATELGGGLSAEFMGGMAAVVLGILALLNVEPMVLLAVAVIVLGGAVLLSSGAAPRLNALSLGKDAHHLTHEIFREAVIGSAGAQVMVGGGTVVLGILALVGINPEVLILVALLSVGASVFLTGAAVTGRLGMLFEGEA